MRSTKISRVVCRELGHEGEVRVYRSAYFGQGSGPIIIDELACNGTEVTLAQCPHGGWLSHGCSHANDVGVSCGTPG